jgi:cardiolipin synthase A/B
MKVRRPATSTVLAKSAKASRASKGNPAAKAASRRPVAFEPSQGKAVSAYGTPGFDALLDRTTHSQNTTGNRVTPLFDGAKSFTERNRLIDAATSSIHLQTFIFTADETGWDLARRLAKKAEAGLSVRVIYDGVGSNRSGNEIFDFMKKAGVEVREYGDPLRQFWDLNDRWHEKHLIVDGTASIEGGMNIADRYAFGGSGRLILSPGHKSEAPWRDTDVKVEGPAVRGAQEAFLKNWKELGKDVTPAQREKLLPRLAEISGGADVRAVQARPDEEGQPNIDALYLHSINAAKKSIVIENAYFVPPKDLREALIAAAKRGVDVRIMTNSKASNDIGVVTDCARYFYDPLIAAGAKIFERQGSTVHSKMATFDGQFSIVGSANLNGRSRGRDSEFVFAIRSEETAGALEKRFAAGLEQTDRVTVKDLKKEGFFTNLKQWALSALAWTF